MQFKHFIAEETFSTPESKLKNPRGYRSQVIKKAQELVRRIEQVSFTEDEHMDMRAGIERAKKSIEARLEALAKAEAEIEKMLPELKKVR